MFKTELNYFDGCETIEDVKDRYKELIKEHHPDLGGSNAVMREINTEYEKVKNGLGEVGQAELGADEGYQDVIDQINHLAGLKIELIGSWLWVSGNTYAHKDELNETPLNFSGDRKKWYWFPGVNAEDEDDDDWIPPTNQDFDTIKSKYGVEEIETDAPENLVGA